MTTAHTSSPLAHVSAQELERLVLSWRTCAASGQFESRCMAKAIFTEQHRRLATPVDSSAPTKTPFNFVSEKLFKLTEFSKFSHLHRSNNKARKLQQQMIHQSRWQDAGNAFQID